jgi:hypothetical protein
MNSSEQKDYEHATPTADQVRETIDRIKRKLAEGHSADMQQISEGYRQAIAILENSGLKDEQSATGIDPDITGTIAALAVRYLQGESSADTLLNYPAKKQ